jgi:hypothetical protein
MRTDLETEDIGTGLSSSAATSAREFDVPEGRRRRSAYVRLWATRVGLAALSFLIACACGVVTGLRALDGAAAAIWIRGAVVLGGVILTAVVARGVSLTLTRAAKVQVDAAGTLLRSQALGSPRRWAIWLSTSWLGCIAAYFLNEHRSATPGLVDLLPARPLDVIVALIGLGIVTPYIHDLAVGAPVRCWPWSAQPQRDSRIREDLDIFGVVSRLSPPLLFALFLAVGMYLGALAAGAHNLAKLFGGFGVTGLFVAAVLAAPALLQAQADWIEERWRSRWYPNQLLAATYVRSYLHRVHQLIVVGQVLVWGVALGTLVAGRPRVWHVMAKPTTVSIPIALLGWLLIRMLWRWAPDSLEPEPIGTEAVLARQRELMQFAGYALVGGSVCTLVAVVIS